MEGLKTKEHETGNKGKVENKREKEMETKIKTKGHETAIKEHEMGDKLAEQDKLKEIMVEGETTIDDDVLAAIAGVAAQEVEGVASMGDTSIRRHISETLGIAEKRSRGVETEHGKEEAIVDLTLKVLYGFNIPEIIIQVRKNVATRLLNLCGLVAKEVNVAVSGVEFPEKKPGRVK